MSHTRDVAEIRLDQRASFKKTAPRIFEGVVARTHAPGDGLVYPAGEEYRDEEELANMASQLAGIRVVTYAVPDPTNPLGHPDDLLVNGVEHHEIGIIQSGRVEDGKAIASIYIHDAAALQEIEDGTRELSLGYRCGLDSGRFQRSGIVDHLSIVPRARCGSVCALRVDSAGNATGYAEPALASSVPDATTLSMATLPQGSVEALVNTEAFQNAVKSLLDAQPVSVALSEPVMLAPCACNSHAMPHTKDSNMTVEEIQTKLNEALATAEALKAEIATLNTDAAKKDEAAKLALDSATADLKAEVARAEKLAGEIEGVKADAQTKIDAAESARTDADIKAFAEAVSARVELFADAAAVGIEEYTAKTDREIKVAIVAKVDEMDVADTMSADYVNGMYAGAMKRHAKASASVAEVRQIIVENRDSAVVETNPLKKEAEIAAAVEAKRANRWR